MQLFLIRHADAVGEIAGLPDAARALDKIGRQRARELGKRLRWHDCTPSLIWSSPTVRAVQTVEVIAGVIGWREAIDVIAALAPDGDPRDVVAMLAALPADAVVILAGHGPMLRDLLALLCPDTGGIELRRAEAVRIDNGRVRWWFAWDDEAPRSA